MSMKLYQCFLYESRCYKAQKYITPTRIIVHSTGANNTSIKRYIQPHKNQAQGMAQILPTAKNFTRKEMLNLLGTNIYGNSWNRAGASVAPHAALGKLANGELAVVQCLPWTMRPWGCGSGSKGSFNSCTIQFEICEDNTKSAEYCRQTYDLAVEFCAYLCKLYGIAPEMIVSHREACLMGYASNHGDPEHWWSKHQLTMDGFRAAVKAKLEGKAQEEPKVTFAIGEKVKLASDAAYYDGKKIPAWVKASALYVRSIKGDRAVVSIFKSGAITGAVNVKHLRKR